MNFGSVLLYVTSYFGLFTAILFFLSFFHNKKKLANPTPKDLPGVTIAVPALNEQATIAATLKSLLQLDYPKKKMDIIVIDDGSTDKTYEIAMKFKKQYPDRIRVFRKDKNSGKADSLNLALRHSRGELFGALDADSFVDQDCLKKMVGHFTKKQIMAVTPSLKIHKPKGLWQNIQYIEYLIGVYLRKVFAYFGSIHVTPGPFTIFRKSFFDMYGGYDEDNLTEDIEVALRIQSKNYIIENSMDASVRTVGPRSFGALYHQRRRWYLGFVNNVLNYKSLFSKKHGNLGLFVLPGAFISIFLVVALFLYLFFKTADYLYTGVLNLMAINFDLMPWLQFRFDPFFINLDPILILSMISLMTGVIVIYLAKKHSAEKGGIKIAYVLYLLVYWAVFAFWWMVAFHAKIRRKKVGWGKPVVIEQQT